LTSGLIQAVHIKTAVSHVPLRRNISTPVRVTDLVEALKDVASLVVCTRKKIFLLRLEPSFQWKLQRNTLV